MRIGGINIGGSVSTMTINGMEIQLRGRQIYVNGKRYTPAEGSEDDPGEDMSPKQIQLDRDGRIQGNVYGDLIVVAPGPVSLVVEGYVEGSVTIENGSLRTENIGGSAKAGNNIEAKNVGGSAKAEGDIIVNVVGGSVKAGRDVIRGS